MKIEQARKLKVGDRIWFPADRGENAGYDNVKSISEGENTNIHGILYKWIGIEKGGVWPSNRIKN